MNWTLPSMAMIARHRALSSTASISRKWIGVCKYWLESHEILTSCFRFWGVAFRVACYVSPGDVHQRLDSDLGCSWKGKVRRMIDRQHAWRVWASNLVVLRQLWQTRITANWMQNRRLLIDLTEHRSKYRIMASRPFANDSCHTKLCKTWRRPYRILALYRRILPVVRGSNIVRRTSSTAWKEKCENAS